MQTDPSQHISFQRSVGKSLLILSLCLPFVMIGLIVATGAFDAPGNQGDGLIFGLICVVFFGFLGVYGTIRLIRNPRQAIEIGPDGIRDTRISEKIIPWTKIIEITTWSSRGSSMIMLELEPEFEKSLNQSKFYRAYKFANRLVGAKGHCLNPVGYSVSFSDFSNTIAEYASAHHSPAMDD
ncbi:STM3941 family protein [uncultured Roseibium sp.]|uniref:STM3941 family protein n=1 Tax=uncultured Roseibium sp. TaxID=1936171 RepID=UPI0026032944|nr:STM3941 family protein [uncultured Roseibium sp.]